MSPAPCSRRLRLADGARPRPRPSAGLTVLAVAVSAAAIGTVARPARAAVPTGSPTVAAERTAPAPEATLVRLTGDRIGRGRSASSATSVDLLRADGSVRHVATVRNDGEIPAPAVSPDGTQVAFARPGATIAVVRLRDGRVRTLTPPDRPATARRADARTAGVPDPDWAGMEGVPIDWASDGRTLVAHGLLRRAPVRWLGALHETRSVRCDVVRRRCSSAGGDAAAELGALAGGRTLRLDAPSSAPTAHADGTDTELGLPADERRAALRAAERPVPSVASVTSDVAAVGRRLPTGPALSSPRRGVRAYELTGLGATGVLLRPTRVTLRRSAPPARTLLVGVRQERPWLVTPAGHLQRLPHRLGTPVGALPDGRWLQSSPRADGGGEPQLTAVDRRGAATPLLVGGRPVTPVRLTLESGLPDAFAVHARVRDAWPVGDGTVAVALEDPGDDAASALVSIDGIPVARPAPDRALVVLPLDGASPARLLDHTIGASYAAR